ncbi:MAG: ParB/RepB/Spo0J family partition protein, partial [Burkholderiaceae bacterium]|nr:ParB/RepB/Spo0J family partition protein [Burkholderiaceae bacterium]
MNATVESNFAKPHFGDIPLQSVIPSKTNPRKSFNQAALEELAASIKSMGVAQPILVRPLPTTAEHIDCVEIVAGERRYLASKIAGMLTIPAVCREMTDAEAKQIQIIENLQREDVHEIEEAEGFERLMKEHGQTALEIAKAVGKSKEYVYGRLKLCALEPEARQAFYDGKLNASTALLVARIPVRALQLKATTEVGRAGIDAPLSYRAAKEHIQNHYMLNLSEATFNIRETKLVKGAGPCVRCPKRTGAQPEIYPDVAEDTCTDPDCFESKRTAHNEKIEQAVAKKGLEILTGREAHAGIHKRGLISASSNIAQVARTVDKTKTNTSIIDVLPADKAPNIKAYFKWESGEMIPLYDKAELRTALEKAGICMTAAQEKEAAEKANTELAKSNPKKAQAERTAAAERAARCERAKRETKYRVAVYDEIRKYLTQPEQIEAAMRKIAQQAVADFGFDAAFSARYPKGVGVLATVSEKFVREADMSTLVGFTLDLMLGSDLTLEEYHMKNSNPTGLHKELEALAVECGVDLDLIRKELAPAQVEKAATPAVKKDIKAIKAVVAKKTKEAKTPEAESEYPADTPADNATPTLNPLAANAAWPFPTREQREAAMAKESV